MVVTPEAATSNFVIMLHVWSLVLNCVTADYTVQVLYKLVGM